MQLPLQITVRHMDHWPAREARTRERAEELYQLCDRITSCHVIVESQNHRHHQRGPFENRIDLTVPGREIVASHDSGANYAHHDAHVAVRDAFDALRRRLEDYARERRAVRRTERQPDGLIP